MPLVNDMSEEYDKDESSNLQQQTMKALQPLINVTIVPEDNNKQVRSNSSPSMMPHRFKKNHMMMLNTK